MQKNKNIIEPEDIIGNESEADGTPLTEDEIAERVKEEAGLLFEGPKLTGGSYSRNSDELRRLGSQVDTQEGLSNDHQLGLNQSKLEVAENTTVGFAKGALGGFLSGADWDIEGMVNTWQGEEKEFGSWLSELGTKLQKSAQEDNPIYGEGDDMKSGVYWAKMVQNLGFTGGIIAEAFAEQALLTAVSGATFGAAAPVQGTALATKLPKLATTLSKFKNALTGTTRAKKVASAGVRFGAGQGIKESYMNALETGRSMKQKYLDLGYDEKFATEKAGEAAATGFKAELVPLMALNAMQFGAMSKYNPLVKGSGQATQGFSGIIEGVSNAVTKGIKNKALKGSIAFGLESLSEGVEEVIQTGISQYAQHKTLKDSKNEFGSLNLANHETRDSFIAGVLGGVLFSSGGKIKSKIEERANIKKYGDEYSSLIQGSSEKTMELMKELNTAIQTGNTQKVAEVRASMSNTNLFTALAMDVKMGKDTAFTDYVANLEKTKKIISDAVENNDVETLTNLGYIKDGKPTTDLNKTIEEFDKFIQEANTTKDLFLKESSESLDPEQAMHIAEHSLKLSQINEFKEAAQTAHEEFKASEVLYPGLSKDAQEIFELRAEKFALEALEDDNGVITHTKGQKDRYLEITAGIDELSINLTEEDVEALNVIDYSVSAQSKYDTLQLDKAHKSLTKSLIDLKTPGNKEKRQKEKRTAVVVNNKNNSEVLSEVEKQATTPEEKETIKGAVEEAKGTEHLSKIVGDESQTSGLHEGVSSEQDFINLLEEVKLNRQISAEELEGKFEPLEIEQMSEVMLNKFKVGVQKYYNGYESKFGKVPTFEEFVRDFLSKTSHSKLDEMYNAFVEGWKRNKYPSSNYEEVYGNIFNTLEGIAQELVDIFDNDHQPIPSKTTGKEVNKEIVAIEKAIEDSTKNVVQLDENNQPYTKPATSKKVYGSSTMSFLSVEHQAVQKVNPDTGETYIVYQDVSSNLFDAPDVESKRLLSSSVANVGDTFTVKRPNNYEDIMVSNWVDGVKQPDAISFKEWVELHNVTPGSQAWLDKVPLVYTSAGIQYAFVEDIDTIQGSFVSQEVKDTTIKNTSKIRNFKGDSLEVKVIEKKSGPFIKRKAHDLAPIPLSENNPQIALATVSDTGELLINGDATKPFRDGSKKLITKGPFKIGYTYEIRKGVNKDEYIALPVDRLSLSPEASHTVQKLIEVYLLQQDISDTFGQRKELNAINETITALTKSNIAPFISKDNREGGVRDDAFFKLLKDYINPHFIPKNITNIEKYIQDTFREGESFLMVRGKDIIVGTKGEVIYGDKSFLFLNPYKVGDIQDSSKVSSLTKETVESFLEVLPKVLSNIRQNTHNTTLAKKGKLLTISKEGIVSNEQSYEQYLKDNYVTDVNSYNVGTAENPDYVTTIQPIIKVRPVISESSEVSTQEEVSTSVVEDTKESTEITEEKLVTEILKTSTPFDGYIEDLKRTIGGIEGLSISEENKLINFLYNTIASKIDIEESNSLNKEEAKNQAIKELADIILAYEDRLLSIGVPTEENAELIAEVQKKLSIITEHKDILIAKAFEYLDQQTQISEITVGNNQVEKDRNKSALEENGKNTLAYIIKRKFQGTKAVNPDGTFKRDFLDLPVFVGMDKVYDTLNYVFSYPNPIQSDFVQIIERLEAFEENIPWLSQIIETLEEGNEDFVNSFMYNFVKNNANTKFVMYSKNNEGEYSLQVYDSNSNEVTRVIRNSWENNLKASNLFQRIQGKQAISKTVAKELYEESAKFDENTSTELLSSWLEKLGITLKEETLQALKENKLKGVNGKIIPFNSMFRESGKTNGIFGSLRYYLKNIQSVDNTSYEDNPKNHPYSDISNILRALSDLEAKNSDYVPTTSFRDGDKTVNSISPTTFVSDTALKLKTDNSYLDTLSGMSYNGKSFILELLKTNPEFRNKFNLSYLGNKALAELRGKSKKDMSITEQSPAEHELTKIGLLQDRDQGDIKDSRTKETTTVAKGNIKTRFARMFLPTMSDKSRMMIMDTAVLDLDDTHFEENGAMKDYLVEFIYSQVIASEATRIVNYIEKNKISDIEGYDFAAKIFHHFPEANSILNSESGLKALQLLIQSKDKKSEYYNSYTKEDFLSDIKEGAKDVIQKTIDAEVKTTKERWESYGFDRGFLNQAYLNNFAGTEAEKFELAIKDYVINNILSNTQAFMLYAGDPALYGKNGAKKHFIDGKPYLPKHELSYVSISEDINAVNVGKRLASLIAPGSKIADSLNKEYKQLFIKDVIDVSENLETLVSLHYPEKLKKFKTDFEKYKNLKQASAKERHLKALKKAYPKIKDFFELEGTDAQEYTTLLEHITIMKGQGRMSINKFKELKVKIDEQKKAEAKGEPIPESAIISDEDLKIILQPLKPVHTGFKTEDDVMRMVYIKSSSFPLIPQITSSTESNNLRLLLEKLEGEGDMPVRASYSTANKVGSTTKAIDVYNQDGTFNTKLTDKQIQGATKVLSRDNLRIQQDVPPKFASKNKDEVALVTQAVKLLFGNGILNSKAKFAYKGKNIGIKTLFNSYQESYRNLVELKTQKLRDELGLDSDNKVIDLVESTKKLQKLLVKEAKGKGYSQQDLEALSLIEDESTGEIKVDFKSPIWLSPNSNKFESLVNSIITNRISNMKLPGNSYVAGSEYGFKTQKDLEGVQANRIIYTAGFKGELKAYSKNNLTQVFLPSRLRDNEGNLIKFILEDGSHNEKYVNKDENGRLTLKEDMIDKELLQLTTVRIPTSSHVSMTQIEVAGFLPPEAGDLIIVPRNLTVQKGLDFDVDKETGLFLNHKISEDGSIRKVVKEDLLDIPLTWEEQHDALYDELQENKEKLFSGDIYKKTEELNEEYLENMYTLLFLNAELESLGEESLEVDQLMNAIFGDAPSPANIKNEIALFQKKIKETKASQQKIKGLRSLFKDLDKAFKEDKKLIKGISESYQKKLIQRKEEKILENDIISAMASVLGSHSPEVQKKINKVLSMDSAREQAEKLSSKTKNKYFTPLAPSYQLDKMALGAAGKLGIGVYSNYVVLHSLLQQTPEPVEIGLRSSKGNDTSLKINIGGMTSNGILGNQTTLATKLDLQRDIAEVFAERQNTATDNEKEQIMGRLNINSHTINVESFLIALGFDLDSFEVTDGNGDKKTVEVSLPYLLMSQPIIKEFVKKMTARDSITVSEKPSEQSIIASLAKEFGFTELISEEINGEAGKYLSSRRLYSELSTPTAQNQKNVLALFLALRMPAQKLSRMQSVLNVATNGLGKSRIEARQKYKDYAHFTSSFDKVYIGLYFKGATNLIHTKEGFTPLGSMLHNVTNLGVSAWEDFYPLKHDSIDKYLTSMVRSFGKADEPTSTIVNLKERIYTDMKKYFLTSSVLGLHYGKDANSTRRKLFVDDDNNTSLAKYLQKVVEDSVLKDNPLVSKFTYRIDDSGNASTIRFNNTKMEDYDERHYHNSIIELLDINSPLPSRNGKPYDTRQLAQDLVTYAYLGNGSIGANDFMKYIPMAYLDMIGFNDITRSWNDDRLLDVMLEDFEQQFTQHNPDLLKQIQPKDMKEVVRKPGAKNLYNVISFYPAPHLLKNEELPTHITVRNSKSPNKNKYQIYEFDGVKYTRISTLGQEGMHEYDVNTRNVTSIINNQDKVKNSNASLLADLARMQATGTIEDLSIRENFGIGEETAADVVHNVKSFESSKYPQLKPLLETISEFMPKGLKIEVGAVAPDKDGKERGVGMYKDNTITISPNYIKTASKDELARTVSHELVHSLTSKYINLYINEDGSIKNKNVKLPREIVQLLSLFRETQKHLGKELENFDGSKPLSPRDKRVTYGGTNVHEFLTLVMTEQSFQEEMKDIAYKGQTETLFDKLAAIVDKILQTIFGDKYSINGVTFQGIKTGLEIIKKQNTLEKKGIFAKMSESSDSLQALLEPVETGLTFENPFNC